jgi:hypothetical protein
LDNGGNPVRVRVELYDPRKPERSTIKVALDYVAKFWNDTSTCDIWEEVQGDHF